MANYIKIKAADINVTSIDSDIIIGGVTSVYQGTASGGGDPDGFTVYTSSKRYTFTVTAKGEEWANSFIAAVTANPGGIMSIVQNSTGVKVTAIEIE